MRNGRMWELVASAMRVARSRPPRDRWPGLSIDSERYGLGFGLGRIQAFTRTSPALGPGLMRGRAAAQRLPRNWSSTGGPAAPRRGRSPSAYSRRVSFGQAALAAGGHRREDVARHVALVPVVVRPPSRRAIWRSAETSWRELRPLMKLPFVASPTPMTSAPLIEGGGSFGMPVGKMGLVDDVTTVVLLPGRRPAMRSASSMGWSNGASPPT